MKTKFFLLILALQTAWLLATVVHQENLLRTGPTVMLEAHRVDPRDLLRGDYLILNYTISDVPTNCFLPPVTTALRPGTKIHVALQPGTNGLYVVTRASLNEFTAAAGEVLLRGESAGRGGFATSAVHIAYGIERYFVREGTGNPVGKLTVQAAVSKSGRASIKEVFVDGQPYAEAMKAARP